MPYIARTWQVAPPAPADFLAQCAPLPIVIGQVLYNRGLRTPQEVEDFLACASGGQDLSRLPGIDRAVARIRQALTQGEKVIVYGDYDVDGITATVLLTEALMALGAQVEPYIPSRMDEGYGLNEAALRSLRAQGAALVITVDCGIRSLDEARIARAIGLDLVITDHHEPGPQPPDAVAVVAPRLFPDDPVARLAGGLSGVGLAYQLAVALLDRWRHGHLLASLLDLVALGTIGDVAPLLGENRRLVKRGLEVLNQAKRTGLRALLSVSNLKPGEVDAEAVAYRLTPRLNAAGRLESADLAYRLLTTTDAAVAAELAVKLNALNNRRQALCNQALAVARVAAGLSGDGAAPTQPVIVVSAADFPAGIVGLVASTLARQYYRPALVLTRRDTVSAGSARSIPGFDLIDALESCGDLVEEFGGHRSAVALTVRNASLAALRQRLSQRFVEQFGPLPLSPPLRADAEIPLDDVTWPLSLALERLQPCGSENPPPLFISRGVPLVSLRTVGNGNHLKLRLRGRQTVLDAIGFDLGFLAERLSGKVDVAYHVESEIFNGLRSLSLRIVDVRESDPAQ